MAVEKGALKMIAFSYLGIGSLTWPLFRSGGRTELTFWQWVFNHTIWGPPVEYVPEESYARELEYSLPVELRRLPPPAVESVERAMSFYKLSEPSARKLLTGQGNNGSVGLKHYSDLKADVRHDARYHPIRSLVQPSHPEVREIAQVLHEAPDFVEAAHTFVHTFTTYRAEVGDYWTTPVEMLGARAGDCDDSAILLTSILRNYIPPEEVYCAIGLWDVGGRVDGHMWVVMAGQNGEDLILESTAAPGKPLGGKYILQAIFNDQYAFATDVALEEFELIPVQSQALAIRR